ncbi:MAG: class C beta-lactamase-related serine hydrolase [Candidatus Thorarchaeota archaeon]|nr:MAG: class C beta-lactamase-related serine hydrolase [Candidatus Thorarchaeota archaeon]
MSRQLIIIGFLLLLISAVLPVQGYIYSPSQEFPERDYWPTDRWKNSTPEEQGMDSALLNEMMDRIDENGVHTDSIVIVKNGYLVFEEYPRTNYDIDSRHIIHSCTKSYTSALVGIAIEEGYIESVDSKLIDLLPNRTIDNLDARKESITLDHLLTMTSGFEWDEWTEPYSSYLNSHYQMWFASNNVQHILDTPMAYDPGEVWTYSSGGSHLLGAIVTEATGSYLFDFAIDKLFTPLGIQASNIFWPQDNQGQYWGSGGVEMVPRDMAKFGYLYLNNGTWDGEQVIPSEWVKQSADTLVDFNDYSGYSYQWWTYPTDIVNVYAAVGYRGQYIFVIPELDMVVVFTSSVPPSSGVLQPAILFDYIIPAAMNENSPLMMLGGTITFTTLAITLPILVAGVYYRIRIRNWRKELV